MFPTIIESKFEYSAEAGAFVFIVRVYAGNRVWVASVDLEDRAPPTPNQIAALLVEVAAKIEEDAK